MLRVDCVQLCQGPDVIAYLEDRGGGPRWYVGTTPTGWSNAEVIEDQGEIELLERQIAGEGTGYMIWRAREYNDVQVVVVR